MGRDLLDRVSIEKFAPLDFATQPRSVVTVILLSKREYGEDHGGSGTAGM